METKKKTEKERNNRIVMICHWIESVMIAVTFLLEMLTGRRPVLYGVIILLLALGPVIAELYFWLKDHNTTMIKHLAAMGFGAMYTVIIFTTTNNQLYLYVLPMVVLITVYNDRAYMLKIIVAIMLENAITVGVGAATGMFGYQNAASAVLQIMAVFLFCIYAYLAASTLEKNNHEQLSSIVDAQNKTEKVLEEVSRNAKFMQGGIQEIHDKVAQLQMASETTKEAMGQVSDGVTDTAEAARADEHHWTESGDRGNGNRGHCPENGTDPVSACPGKTGCGRAGTGGGDLRTGQCRGRRKAGNAQSVYYRDEHHCRADQWHYHQNQSTCLKCQY